MPWGKTRGNPGNGKQPKVTKANTGHVHVWEEIYREKKPNGKTYITEKCYEPGCGKTHSWEE